jgi:hypothetical protein
LKKLAGLKGGVYTGGGGGGGGGVYSASFFLHAFSNKMDDRIENKRRFRIINVLV